MTITMSEHLDAEPCDVLRGGDGPVYFLVSGQLYVVHEILGRWIEADSAPVGPAGSASPRSPILGSLGPGTAGPDDPSVHDPSLHDSSLDEPHPATGAGTVPAPRTHAEPRHHTAAGHIEPAARADLPVQVEHWLVTASAGRFGAPAVYRLQRRPASPGIGPDSWTVRCQRR
jgi:hypothetical protein